MKKTTSQQAHDIAKQCTDHIVKSRGGQINDVWNENPVIWWSNVYSSAALTSEYFDTLVNTIVDMRIRANDFENPLAQYKSGDLPLGFGQTEIYINPQTGRYFAINPEQDSNGDVYYPGKNYTDGVITNGIGANTNYDIVTTINDGVGETNAAVNRNSHIMLDKLPDVKQIFFRVNYGRQYQRTYSAVDLQKSATTWDAYAQFIDGISRDISSSVQIDDYNAMRSLFSTGVSRGIIPLYPINALSTENDAKTLLQLARQFHTDFQFPSENYSGWNISNPGDSITTWSKPDGISILITSQATSVIDVQALASAFNLEYANFIGKRQLVDYIDENKNVKAIIFDDFLIHCVDVMDQTGNFYNPATTKENIFRNKQAIMSLNPFANAVAFTTNTFTTVTGVQPTDWTTAIGKYYKKSTIGTYIGINGNNTTYQAGEFYQIN